MKQPSKFKIECSSHWATGGSVVSRVEIQFHHNYTSHRGQYVWFVQDRFRLPNTHCLGYKSDTIFFLNYESE